MEELKRLDRKTRNFLTMAKIHHPKADLYRLYIPINASGRGSCTTRNYLQNKENWPKHISQEKRCLPPHNCKGHDHGKKTKSIHH